MALPAIFDRLRLPVIGSPLFIVSGPDLVIAQCKAGIVGSFPALNARPQPLLDEWLHRITEELAAWDRDNPDRLSAPFAVNQIVHRSNDRLEADIATCERSEEHTSELQSLMRISYAGFCLKKKKKQYIHHNTKQQ